MEVEEKQRGVRVYNLSAGKSLPEWLAEGRRTALRYNQDFRRRIELLHDAHFPIAAQRVRMSPDGRFIFATGTYRPQLKVFDVAQLGLKFERHVDCEVVQFQILTDDFSKVVLLQSDRTLEFHARFGTYYKTRVPKFGRDMIYHTASCDLFVAGSSSEIYRLNLEQGRFLNPLQGSAASYNVATQSSIHGLLAFGGENGTVDFFDPRTKSKAADLNVTKALLSLEDWNDRDNVEVTALAYENTNGLTLGVGTSTGHCLLYDLRAPMPFIVKDHKYDLPIKSVIFHSSGLTLSADSKIIKIWDPRNEGRVVGNVEPGGDVNDMVVVGDSGLIMAACETPRIQMFYVPALSPAPEWCSFLDNLTEELEEDRNRVIYDDYTFITREELDRLGTTKMLKGTEYLRPYMHGFFMDTRLYNKLKSLADPFAYAKYRAERVQQARAERAATRITTKTNTQPTAKTQAAGDDRFGALRTDKEFAIDTNDPSFKRIRAARPAGFEKVLARVDEQKQGPKKKKQPKSKKQKVQHAAEEEKPGQRLVEFQDSGQVGWAGAYSDAALTDQKWRTEAPLAARLQTLAEEGDDASHAYSRSRTGGMSLTYTPAERPAKRKTPEAPTPPKGSKTNRRAANKMIGLHLDH